MRSSLAGAFLLSTLLSSLLVTAAPAQQEQRETSNNAFGWSARKYDSYKAVGSTVAKAAQTGQWAAQSTCDLSKAQMPQAPKPLPPPSEGLVLSHVAIGRGTQNYSCPKGGDPTAAPTPVGAMASLFNVSCMAANQPQLVTMMPSIGVRYPVPTSGDSSAPANMLLSGHHYFADLTTPFFNMVTDEANYGEVAAQKLNATAAPNAAKDVTWLKLSAKAGDWQFMEVYRVNTAGGQPPKICYNQSETFEVDYAAEYWFWAPPAK